MREEFGDVIMRGKVSGESEVVVIRTRLFTVVQASVIILENCR